MQTETKPALWAHFHQAIEEIGEFADQVEKTLAPTAKQQYLQTLAIADTLALLGEINDSIAGKIGKRNQLNIPLLSRKGQLEEARAMVLLGGTIDGKNAEIRDAQLLLALKEDTTYQQARAVVDDIERQIADVELEMESLRGKQAALKINLRLIAAQLEYLAEPR